MPSRLVIYVEEEAERFEMPGMVFDSSEIASSRQNRTDTYMNSQTARAHVKSAQFKPEQNPSTKKSGSGHKVSPLTKRCLQLLPAVKGVIIFSNGVSVSLGVLDTFQGRTHIQ